MANRLDTLDTAQFAFRTDAVVVEGMKVAVDKLDGLDETARRLALPDFAEPPATQPFQQPITGNRLRSAFVDCVHGVVLDLVTILLVKPRSRFAPRPLFLRF